jgi:hypothetical protein
MKATSVSQVGEYFPLFLCRVLKKSTRQTPLPCSFQKHTAKKRAKISSFSFAAKISRFFFSAPIYPAFAVFFLLVHGKDPPLP